jgi:hypothetical protein
VIEDIGTENRIWEFSKYDGGDSNSSAYEDWGGGFSEVAPILTRLKCSRPLIVTDAFLVSCGLAEKLQDQIVQAGIPCEVFSGTVTKLKIPTCAGATVCRHRCGMVCRPQLWLGGG